jgi:dihydrofolate reductase
MIKAILACDEQWGIGRNGTLPWPKNSADLKWFKQQTFGHIVIMGRRTWEAEGMPKPLPGRINIVITSNGSIDEGPNYTTTLEKLPTILDNYNEEKWIIGGAILVENYIKSIDELYLSRIEGNWKCDTFLPEELITGNFVLQEVQNDRELTIEKWIKDEAVS